MRPVEHEILIPAGLNGPARSANGGIAAGFIGRLVSGPAQVRLHQPPPLSTPMAVRRDGDEVTAFVEGEPVLTARPAVVDLALPAVPLAEARPVTGGGQRSAPTCVVCGPDHPTSMSVFPGPLPGRSVYAAAWTPPPWTAGKDGCVRPELLWGVLDCPGGFAVADPPGSEPFFPALGTIAVDLRLPVAVGETVVVVAWPTGPREGRKLHAGTAILGARGDVRAVARQTCVAMPLEWAVQ